MISIRKAVKEDSEFIFNMIKELAEYEKCLDRVQTNPEQIKNDGFNENALFNCLILEHEGNAVGYALYYYRYSTWMGTSLYLEDLYVQPKKRGLKLGKMAMVELAKIAVETDCKRFEWQVIDWNEPSIKFYKSIKTDLDNEWINCRLEDNRILELANRTI